jgi:TolB-like protein/Tfp pilus assembly protein PilF
MASIIPGYEYDIFISYRHNDNRSGWVSDFVKTLQQELAATIKEQVTVYFDINPHDGLTETHDVDESLKEKLKCLVFIPIISQTYCDQKSFAWKYEFLAFRNKAEEDFLGLKVKLQNGNVASRILPVRIHDLDDSDREQIETELRGFLRPVDFIYRSPGVVRPLLAGEIDPKSNQEHTYYLDQVNKLVRAIKELITSMKSPLPVTKHQFHVKKTDEPARLKKLVITTLFIFLGLLALGVYYFSAFGRGKVEPDKSIAVLPFDDLSPNNDQEHFGVGMMDEILNDLFRLNNLKVISRTSSMSYRGSKKPLRQIASELEVANILVGSVEKNGESVTIRVQLIDGRTDTQLWGETYEREFKDAFSIQSEIARAVAEALKVRMSHDVEASIEKPPTANMEAYDLYLQASTYYWWEKPDPVKAFDHDIELLNKAISLDSCFAEAYSYLAYHWLNAGNDSGTLSTDEVVSKVKPLVQKALKLNPDLVSAHYTSALLHLWFQLDFNIVENEYQRIRQLSPSNSGAINFLADYLMAAGRSDEAIDISEKALEDDRKSPTKWSIVAYAYFYNKQANKAFETIETAKNLFGEDPFVRRTFIRLKTFGGKYEDAIREYEKDTAFVSGTAPPVILSAIAASYFKTGQSDKAKKILNRITGMSKISPVRSPSFFAASVFAVMGDKLNAFRYLEKAIADREVEIFWTKEYPMFKSLHEEPRWKEIINKLKYPAN